MAINKEVWRLVPPNKKAKKGRDVNIWLDYLELACIHSYGGTMSQDEMIDEIKQISDDYINENKAEDDDDDDAAELNMHWSNTAYDWFEYFKSRREIYKSYYPFDVNGDVIILKKRQTTKRKIYLAMLMASCLNSASGKTMIDLTATFEYVSLKAFKKMLPNNSKAFLFGKNKLNKGNKFSGKLIDKIEALGKELGELDTEFDPEDFDKRDNGDGGLDIFGYIPIDNRNKLNIPIYFGQCACGKDWKNKIHECDSETWEANISFSNTTKPSHMMFIPYSYRNLNGEWVNKRSLRNAILFDRERIVKQLGDKSQTYFSKLPAYGLVNKLLAS